MFMALDNDVNSKCLFICLLVPPPILFETIGVLQSNLTGRNVCRDNHISQTQNQ